MNTEIKVFVYGSLRTGEGNNDVIAPYIESVEKITLEGFGMWSLKAFPVIFPVSDETATIVGELITLKESTYEEAIASLDQLEGFTSQDQDRNLYNRYRSSTEVNGNREEFYIYIGGTRLAENTDAGQYPFVRNGDWSKYLVDQENIERIGAYSE